MKIARLIEYFPDTIQGGLIPNAHYISKYQIEQGHDVRIFCFSEGEPHEAVVNRIPVVRVRRPRAVRIFGGMALFESIRKSGFEPEMVHCIGTIPFGWLFPFAKKKLNSKYCLSVHGSIFPLKTSKVHGVKSWLDSFEYSKLIAFLAKRVDLVLPIAEFIKKELVSVGVEEGKIEIIPPGIDYELFAKAKSIPKTDDRFVILNVGRFAQKKDIPTLLRAVALLDDNSVVLKLIGGKPTDNDYDNIMSLIKELNLEKKVEILESVPYTELPTVYAQADLFVLSSIMEPRGKVVQEAMAAGIPVIATRQGGVVDFIEDGRNGLLIEPGSEKELSKAIKEVQQEEKLLEAMQRKAVATAQQVDWRIIATKYSKAYSEVV